VISILIKVKQPYPVKKKIVEKPPRNSAGFYGGGHGLRWALRAKGRRRKVKAYWGLEV
jgi:hypothetical protein